MQRIESESLSMYPTIISVVFIFASFELHWVLERRLIRHIRSDSLAPQKLDLPLFPCILLYYTSRIELVPTAPLISNKMEKKMMLKISEGTLAPHVQSQYNKRILSELYQLY